MEKTGRLDDSLVKGAMDQTEHVEDKFAKDIKVPNGKQKLPETPVQFERRPADDSGKPPTGQ